MFEYVIYPIIGFAAVLLGLEGAWRWLENGVGSRKATYEES